MKNLKPKSRFGHLLVLGPADPVTILRHGKERHWSASRCKCDCGKDVIVPNWRLKTGHVSSCGCQKLRGLRNVIRRKRLPLGAVFGALTVVRPMRDRVDVHGIHHTQSEFRCTCGALIVRDNSAIRRAKAPSCGHDRPWRSPPEHFTVRVPHIGSVFEHLTVLKTKLLKGQRPTVWCRVQCDCGTTFDLWAEHLRHGRIHCCKQCRSAAPNP